MVWVVRPKPCRTGVHHGAWFRSDDRNPQLDKVRTLKDWVHPGSSLGVVSVARPKPPTSTFRTLNDWGPPYQDVQTPRRMGSTLGSGFGRSTETPTSTFRSLNYWDPRPGGWVSVARPKPIHHYVQSFGRLGSPRGSAIEGGFGRTTQTHPPGRGLGRSTQTHPI